MTCIFICIILNAAVSPAQSRHTSFPYFLVHSDNIDKVVDVSLLSSNDVSWLVSWCCLPSTIVTVCCWWGCCCYYRPPADAIAVCFERFRFTLLKLNLILWWELKMFGMLFLLSLLSPFRCFLLPIPPDLFGLKHHSVWAINGKESRRSVPGWAGRAVTVESCTFREGNVFDSLLEL